MVFVHLAEKGYKVNDFVHCMMRIVMSGFVFGLCIVCLLLFLCVRSSYSVYLNVNVLNIFENISQGALTIISVG